MLGSHPVSAVLGAPISATSDTSALNSYVKALTEAGMSVLLCKNGSKEPCDYRTPKQINDDNNAYAIATMTPDAKHPGGAYLSTKEPTRLRSYIRRYRKEAGDDNAPVTLAINVGESNLLVGDCDTAAQRQAFCDWAAELSGIQEMRALLPTVLTPGVFRDGQWIHKDGGHYYFAVDNVHLPARPGSISVSHNGETFALFWLNRYVLIPPSARAEGAYQRVGPVLSLADNPWLVDQIETRTARSRPSNTDHLPSETVEKLIEWYDETPWDDLLVPLGWEKHVPDGCGCPTWNRPGYSTPKSATAHEHGCDRYSDSNDPPIHFWTTNPGDAIWSKIEETGNNGTLTKLQLYAAVAFDGDEPSALYSIPGIEGFTYSQTAVVVTRGVAVGVSMATITDEDDEEVSTFEAIPRSDGSAANTALLINPEDILKTDVVRHDTEAQPAPFGPVAQPHQETVHMGQPIPQFVNTPPQAQAQPAQQQTPFQGASGFPQVGGSAPAPPAAQQASAPAFQQTPFTQQQSPVQQSPFQAAQPAPEIPSPVFGYGTPAPSAPPAGVFGAPAQAPVQPQFPAQQAAPGGVFGAPSDAGAGSPSNVFGQAPAQTPAQGSGNLVPPAAFATPPNQGQSATPFVTGGVTDPATSAATAPATAVGTSAAPTPANASPNITPEQVTGIVSATVQALLPTISQYIVAETLKSLEAAGYQPQAQWP